MSTRAEELRQNDPHFVQDLLRSVPHVAGVAEWLRQTNEVIVNPTLVRPSEEDRLSFSDKGDLQVLVKNEWKRVEVKQRGLQFQSIEDFRYPTIIVDEARLWDQANPKPYCYILTNRNVTCAALVYGETSPHWVRKERWDAPKSRFRTFVECPVSLMKIRKINKVL